MKKMLFALICGVSLSFASVDGFKGLEGTLNIAGGTAHIKCEKVAIKNIMRKHKDISITLAGGGSGMGIKQVSAGLIDLANSGREPTQSEIKKGNLKVFRFAIDGIGISVNPKNPITNLSTKQLQDIFSGKITNYKELGFKSAPINLYTRDESSATRKVFWKRALKKSDISKNAKVISSNAAMKTAMKNDVNAIGILSLGVADSTVKLLSFNGIYPSLDNVKNSSYKVARGLYLLSKGEPQKVAKAYIDYMRSNEGSQIVTKHGFLAVNE